MFADDFRSGFTSKEADNTFYGITSLSFFVFLIELVLNFISQKAYANSFYFWLDLVATLSMITDIGWIMDVLSETTDYHASNA